MKYKLITSKSLEDFNREVTQALNGGWSPYGAPIVTRMESSNKMIYSQGTVFGYHSSKDVIEIYTETDLEKLYNCDFWIARSKDDVIEYADLNSAEFKSEVTIAIREALETGPLFAIIRSVHEDVVKQLKAADINPTPVKEKK